MAYSNGISIGFDTFDRGIDYDGAVYACNCSCSADGLSSHVEGYGSKGLSSTLYITDEDDWCNDSISASVDTMTNKYDDLQDQINALKEQIGKVGYSAKNAGAALKSMFNRMSNTKVSLRNQLQTITEWQTI